MKLYGVLDWSLTMTRVYNNIFDNETELQHFGIKGMKWGVRKAINKSSPKKSSDETVITKKKTRFMDERAREQQYINVYKNRDKLSTRQMKSQIERIKTEKEFRRVAYEEANARNKAVAELKDRKRKQRALAFGLALEVVSKIPINEDKIRKSIDSKDFENDEQYKKAQDNLVTLVKNGQSLAPVLGKIIKETAGVATPVEKVEHYDTSSVYIPGMTNPELLHVGVKGMKWGVRKAASSYKTARRETKSLRDGLKEQKRNVKLARANLGQSQYNTHNVKEYRKNRGGIAIGKDRNIVKGAKFTVKDNKRTYKVEKRKLKTMKKSYRSARRDSYNKLMNS